LTSFRIVTAKEYGSAENYVDGTAIGPGTSNCTRYKIADSTNDYVSSILLHGNEVIIGITVNVGDRKGSFGVTDSRDEVLFEFTKEQPLIGIYGFDGTSFINGLSFITYDLVSFCQNYVAPPVEEEVPEVVEPNTTEEGTAEVDNENENVDTTPVIEEETTVTEKEDE